MKILSPYIIELAPTLDHHWYYVWEVETGINGALLKGKFLGTFPSSTTILNAYPQSPQLTKWIAEQGWNESQAVKSAAGEAGTRIHDAVEALLQGASLRRDKIKLEEWYKLSTFVSWHEKFKPEIIALEMPVFSRKLKFAGRLDCVARIAGEVTLIDWKSSKNVWPQFPLQFASYAQALEEMTDLVIENTACFQMGAKNKDGYRFVLYPDWREHLKVFQNVYETWKYDYGKRAEDPPILELPDELKLSL